MSNKPTWVMGIPVISTDHMPSRDALVDFTFSGGLCATYPEGGFVYLPESPAPTQEWVTPVLAWLREHFGDDSNWVRFDCDADVVEGLPTYEWERA